MMGAVLFSAVMLSTQVEETPPRVDEPATESEAAPPAPAEPEVEYVDDPVSPPSGKIALAAGGAAVGAVALALGAFLVASIPMQILSLCPPIGIAWGLFTMVGFPILAAEAAVLAAQGVAGKYGKRRVSNLVLLAGGAPFACGGLALGAVASLGIAVAIVAILGLSGGSLVGAALLLGVNLASVVVLLVLVGGGFVAAAITVGLLAAFTGRPLVGGEPELNWDIMGVPDAPPMEEDVSPTP